MKFKRALESWRQINMHLPTSRGSGWLRFLLCSICVSLTSLTLGGMTLSYAEDSNQNEELFDDKRGDTAMDQDTLDKAEIAFFDGLTAYRAKKYEKAAEQFKVAYQLVPFRDLLFNVARSYEEQGDTKNAIKYYKMYFDTKPIDETQIIHRLRQLGVRDVGVDHPGPGPQVKQAKGLVARSLLKSQQTGQARD